MGPKERDRRGRGGVRAAFVLLAALALSALGVASASAVVVRLHGKRLSYQPTLRDLVRPRANPLRSLTPEARSGSPSGAVEYHGGPVMPSNTNYALYWDPSGGPEYPAGYESGIDRYLEDLAHDSGGLLNTDSVLVQYGDSLGHFANYDSHFGGALIDTNPYPANGCSAAAKCLTDNQLREEIQRYVEAAKLPMDLEHEYFLLTPPGVESCFEAAGRACSEGATNAAYCAYHGDIPVGKAVIVYANDPYVDGTNCDFGEQHPNNGPADATIGGGLAHEHSESVTDPELNAWYDSKEREVADKCRTFKASTEYGEALGKAPDGASYNQVIDGDLYWYQQEWSNEAGACVQRQLQTPTVKKVSPKTGPKAGGTAVTITGTGFLGSVSVKFGGVASPEVTVNSSTSITAVSPAGSPGTVDVVVTAAGGSSAVTKKDHFKYKPH